MFKKIAAIFLFLSLLSLNAFSMELTGEFDVAANCLSPSIVVWTLSNDSSNAENFSISASGQYSSWINVNGVWIGAEAFDGIVSANSSLKLYAFIKPDNCRLESGKYLIDVFLKNSNAIQKTVTVDLSQSSSIDLNVSTSKETVAQCGNGSFNAIVSNTGKAGEAVELNIDGIPSDWFDFNAPIIFVEKNSTKEVLASLSIPCNAEAKTYPAKVVARIQGTEFGSEKSIDLAIESANKTDFSIPSIKSCIESESFEKIAFKNNGSLDDVLILEISGSNLVSLGEKQVELKAGEQKTVELKIAKAIEAKNETFSLNASSKRFNSRISKTGTIEAADCYNAELEESLIPSQSCLNEKTVFKFNAANKGTKATSVQIDANGLNAVALPNQLVLEVAEKKPFDVSINLPKEPEGAKAFNVSISGNSFRIEKNYSINALNCYDLSIDSNAFNKFNIEAGKSSAFTVFAKNNGTKSQNIALSINSIIQYADENFNWAYAQPRNITVDSNKTGEFYLYIAPPQDAVNGNYSIQLILNATGYSGKKNISFNVFGGTNSELAGPKIGAIAGEKIELHESDGKKIVKFSIQLDNNGIVPVKILKIEAKGFPDANFSFDSGKEFDSNSTIDANATVSVDSNVSKFTLPLKITTSAGIVSKDLNIDLAKNSGSNLAGFAILADWRIGLAVLAIIAIVLTALFVNHMRNKEKAQQSIQKNTQPLWENVNPGTPLSEKSNGFNSSKKGSKNVKKK